MKLKVKVTPEMRVYISHMESLDIDITEFIYPIVSKSFVAGFKASGEGWNGEFGAPYDDDELEKELQEKIIAFMSNLTNG